MFLTILNGTSVYVSLSFTEYVVNAAHHLVIGNTSFHKTAITVVLYSLILLLFSGLAVVEKNLKNRLTLDVNHLFRRELNEKLSHIGWEYYESHETFSQIFEVRQHTNQAILEFVDSIFSYVAVVPAVVVFGYYLLQINLLVIPVYILLVVVFNLVLAGNMFSQLQEYWKNVQPYAQKENYYFEMSGDKVSHQEFRFLRLFDFATSRWEECFNSEFNIKLKIFRKHEITLQTARLLFNIPYILMMIVIGIEVMHGRHEIGFLIMANGLLNQIIDTCLQVQNNITRDHVNQRFFNTWVQVINYKEDPVDLPSADFTDVEFRNISYSYPQSRRKALDGLTLSLKKGQKIAVVGLNGSGKTTFTNILCNLVHEYSGSITDNSQSSFFHPCVSCVIQDFAQYQMTVRENIAAGNTAKDFSDAEIWSLLKQVGMDTFIESLPLGIQTPLGQLDSGIELSKGQWQRIAIARLLAKEDSDIWILDEPTAYLDPISEIKIYEMIYQLSGDRTVLFISHRLGFARRADNILLFQDGRVAESGSHKELLNINGQYARMYEAQKKWYA